MKDLKDGEVGAFGKSHPVAVLDFYAPWCRPCQMLTPLLAKWEKTYTTASFAKVNSDECPVATEAFGVSHLPTIVIMKNGVETKRFVGMISENDFKSAI